MFTKFDKTEFTIIRDDFGGGATFTDDLGRKYRTMISGPGAPWLFIWQNENWVILRQLDQPDDYHAAQAAVGHVNSNAMRAGYD